MPTQEDIENQLKLLQAHRNTLAIYLEQLAMHSVPHAPPAIFHGIRDARTNIRRIKKLLNDYSVPVEDYQDDETVEGTISALPPPTEIAPNQIRVIVESAHTGQCIYLSVLPRASIGWLIAKSCEELQLSDQAKIGPYTYFKVKWVLVDINAERAWDELDRWYQQRLTALTLVNDSFKYSESEDARLEDIGVYNGIVFHLCAIEDVRYQPPEAEPEKHSQ